MDYYGLEYLKKEIKRNYKRYIWKIKQEEKVYLKTLKPATKGTSDSK